MTWNEAKLNSDKLTSAIETLLEESKPKSIIDVLTAVKKVDGNTSALPNPNSEGQYCQLVLYPSQKWNTWSSTSMSITKYNLYR